MLICISLLKQGYERATSLRDKLEKEIDILNKRQEREAAGKTNRDRQDLDLEKVQKDFSNIFTDIYLAIEEVKVMKPDSTYRLSGIKVSLPVLLSRADDAKTYEEIKNILDLIINMLDDFVNLHGYDYLNEYSYLYSFADKMGDYGIGEDISPQSLIVIKNMIAWKHKPANILEASVKNGYLGSVLKEQVPDINIYGIDSYKRLYGENKENYKRVISGALKGATISQNAFDAAFCLPKISLTQIQVRGVNIRLEKEYLSRISDCIRDDGIMIFGIPYFRMYKDICEYLCKTYDDITLFKPNDSGCGLIYIIGKKRKLPLAPFEIDRQTYSRLRRLPFYYKDMINEQHYTYSLPQYPLEIKKFRGTEPSEQELAEIFEKSAATKAFWKAQKIERLTNSSARPLLPFNVGQLGLILTSGCLDGIINEGNGYCHAVKGRVVKKHYTQETGRTSGEIQLTTTYANKVEINVFLPDGTYKSLA